MSIKRYVSIFVCQCKLRNLGLYPELSWMCLILVKKVPSTFISGGKVVNLLAKNGLVLAETPSHLEYLADIT